MFNFPNLFVKSRTLIQNTNFGTIDLETLSINESGDQRAYAGGYCIKLGDGFIINKFMSNDINDSIILTIIDSIFDNIRKKDNESLNAQKLRNRPTLYAHNLGKFDAIPIIHGLIEKVATEKYEIKVTWKSEENKVLAIRITEKQTKLNIKLVDSSSFFNFNSLENLLKTHNLDVLKGNFPHSFIKSHNLNYVGNKPSIEFYKNITKEEYDNIPLENWNIRTELLKYLENDLIGLFKLIELYHNKYFERYNLNMMDNLTLPSLAKDIFTTNYYDQNDQIKVIKGKLEDQIRTSYLGGMIHVLNSKEINQGYHYDMNSQYPNAMLKDMPTGNPVLTSEKDLNKLFGFTYGTIYPPSEEQLRVPLIRQRLEDEVIYPRKPFKAMIFTELIKEAIKYGYKFDVEFSYNFDRTPDVFKKYVLELYQDKQNATDVATRNISKLLLNSLYGKFGMKEIDSVIKIMPNYEAAQISNSYHVDYIHLLNSDCSLVKYRGRLPKEARELFANPELNINVPEWTAKSLSKEMLKEYNPQYL